MRAVRHILNALAALLLTATLMASRCSEPDFPTPVPPEPEPVSEDQTAFMAKSTIGLYIRSEGIVIYDEDSFQKAWNSEGHTFRIQRDDQRAYMHVHAASGSNASSSYQIEYKTDNRDVTLMILRLQPVKAENANIWLWNETMKTGIIIPEYLD